MAIKLDARQISHGRPRMLTRDLFAIANLLVIISGTRILKKLDTRKYQYAQCPPHFQKLAAIPCEMQKKGFSNNIQQ